MTHPEYLYLLTRAELAHKIRREKAQEGIAFIPSRAFIDLENGLGAYVEFSDDTARLNLRDYQDRPTLLLETAVKFFGSLDRVFLVGHRMEDAVYLTYEGPKPTNPFPVPKT
jgi:hypothetical protein